MSFNLTSLHSALPSADRLPRIDDGLILTGEPLEELLSALEEGEVHLIGEGPERSLTNALAVWRVWRGSDTPFYGLWASSKPWKDGDSEWDKPIHWTWERVVVNISYLEEVHNGVYSQVFSRDDRVEELYAPHLSIAEQGTANSLLVTTPSSALTSFAEWSNCYNRLAALLRLRHSSGMNKRDLVERQLNSQVDATKLSSAFFRLPTEVIWFQCPYPSSSDDQSPSQLIQNFFASASKVQISGDYLLLGLVSSYLTSFKYRLHNIYTLGANSYRFLGTTKEIITPLLLFGYKHRGSRSEWNPHARIINEHDTWVFQRTDCEE